MGNIRRNFFRTLSLKAVAKTYPEILRPYLTHKDAVNSISLGAAHFNNTS